MATINDLIHIAEQDLRTMGKSQSIAFASDLLCTSRNRLIVVCDGDEKVFGVLSRADILRGVHQEKCSFDTACEGLATQNVISCKVDDKLDDVWARMSESNLNAIPIVSDDNKPLGVISSKCVLVRLLATSRNEESLMRDYISGMGYH